MHRLSFVLSLLAIAIASPAHGTEATRPLGCDRALAPFDRSAYLLTVTAGESFTLAAPTVRHIRVDDPALARVVHDSAEARHRVDALAAGKVLLRVYSSDKEELSHYERDHGLRLDVTTIILTVEDEGTS